MKKILYGIITGLFLMGSSLFAADGDLIVNGNAGIGTTSPVASLNTVGSAGNNWTTSGWNRSIEIPNAAVIKWKKGTTNAWGIGQTSNNLYFAVSTADDNSAVYTAPMYMSSGGVYFNSLAVSQNNFGYANFDSAGGARTVIYMDNSNPDKVHLRNNQRGAGGAITFESKAGGVESARFDVNGNFGIGTTMPGAKLDVYNSSPGSSSFDVASTNGRIKLFNYTDNVNYLESGNNLWNASQLLSFTGYNGANGTFNFVGNVGIGTTTPAYKLDVAGQIRSSSGGFVFPDGTTQTTASVGGGGSSQWTTSGSNIYYNTGNIGIGTTNPTTGLLSIAAPDESVGSAIAIRQSNAETYGFDISLDQSFNGYMFLDRVYGGTKYNVMTFNRDNGNVGIGTTSPGYTLTVNGSSWTSNGAWSGSDIRWKKNIMPLNATLDKILKLKGVNYEWEKDGFKAINFSDGKQIGLIAQDVEKVFPELVRTDDDGYKAISYERLSVLLMKAVQEIAVALDITEAGSSSPSIKSTYKGNEAVLAIDKDGNLGVGTNNPSSRLDVKGDIKTSGGISAASIASSGSITAHGNIVQSSPDLNNYGVSLERTDEDTKYHAWTFWQMNDHDNNKNALEIWEYKANGKGEACTASGILCSPRLVIKEGGNIGIGDDPGNYKLYVDGDLSVNGNTYSKTGQWLLLSDIRFKENITPIESPLEKVLNIEGVSFNWKKEAFRGQKIPEGMHYGVIAQQVENIIPEVVKTDLSGEKTVAYTEIIPVLIEAIKEQQKEMEILKAELKELKERKQ